MASRPSHGLRRRGRRCTATFPYKEQPFTYRLRSYRSLYTSRHRFTSNNKQCRQKFLSLLTYPERIRDRAKAELVYATEPCRVAGVANYDRTATYFDQLWRAAESDGLITAPIA